MNQMVGNQSLLFENPPYIRGWASIVGKKEGEGPLKECFDRIEEDDYFGGETWEQAESMLQKQTLALLLKKTAKKKSDIRYLFAGDLLGQSVATTFGLLDFEIPIFSVYGACSTAGETLSLGAMTVAAGYAKEVVTLTSSHFASAERQFRFPLEYGGQRPPSSTWTVTGSGSFLISNEKGNVKVTGITTGKIVDYGVKDSLNMGAAMAPAAAALIKAHLQDFKSRPEDYDAIITGDLGEVGQKLLLHTLLQDEIDISKVHKDCGIQIFNNKEQKTGSGGSGCGCSAVTLAGYYLPKLSAGQMKKVLFVPTGALLSPISFNEGNSVPGIAYGVLIEHVE